MFSENRSELAIPVVGFLLLGLATLFVAISVFSAKLDNNLGQIDTMAFWWIGILLALVAFFALSKAYIIEGVLFGIFAVFLVVYSDTLTGNMNQLVVLGIALGVVAAILAFMSYRVGDLMVLIMALLTILTFIFVLFIKNVDSFAFIAAGVGFLLVSAVAFISAVLEWLFVQDVAMDLADYMYGDDDEECGCGCEAEE